MSLGSVASIGGSLLSSGIAASASKKAGKTLANGAQSGIDLQKQMYEQSRNDLAPYRNIGTGAEYMLQNLLGIKNSYGQNPQQIESAIGSLYSSALPNSGGAAIYYNPTTGQGNFTGGTGFEDTGIKSYQASKIGDLGGRAAFDEGLAKYQADLNARQGQTDSSFGSLLSSFDNSKFEKDPGYQFRLDEGQKAIERAAASRGGLLSGAATKAALKYSQDYGSNEYGNAYNRYTNDQTNTFNRLATVAGTGQQAINTSAQLGSNYANQASGLLTDQASARANAQVGSANAWSTGLNNIFGGGNLGSSASGYYNPGGGPWGGGSSNLLNVGMLKGGF